MVEIDLSLGEFSAVVARALRGAGYPWGLAEEGAMAARWLAASGLPEVAPAVAALIRASPVEADRCPIVIGARLSDEAPRLPLTLGQVVEPLLLVPSLRGLGDRAAPITLIAPAGSAVVTPDGATVEGGLATGPVHLAVSSGDSAGEPVVTSRIGVAPSVLAVLTGSAQRTYAPSTDDSRTRGAGAGLTDND